MDRIKKALLRLPNEERRKLLEAFARLRAGQPEGLNIKKLKGHSSLYRIRVGNNRLVFEILESGDCVIRYVGRRDDQTYRDF